MRGSYYRMLQESRHSDNLGSGSAARLALGYQSFHGRIWEGEERHARGHAVLTSNYALLLLGVLPAGVGSFCLVTLLLLSVRLSVILGNRIRSLLPASCLATKELGVAGASADVRRGAGMPLVGRAWRVVPSGRDLRL